MNSAPICNAFFETGQPGLDAGRTARHRWVAFGTVICLALFLTPKAARAGDSANAEARFAVEPFSVRAEQTSGSAEVEPDIHLYRAIDLHETPVTDARGRVVGRIDHLVLGQDGQIYAVVEKSAMLEDGARFFALPLSLIVSRRGRLTAVGLTPDQIDAIPPHDALDVRFAIAHGDTIVTIKRAKSSAESAALEAAGQHRKLRERIGLSPSLDPTSRWTATRAMRVSELKVLYIHNTRGEMLGGIERVLLHKPRDRRYAMVGPGGFFGLFDTEVAIPLDRLLLRRNRLLLTFLTSDELDWMTEWRTRLLQPHELQADDWVAVGFQE